MKPVKPMKKNSADGFTLIEMAIVIMVIGLIIAAFAPLYSLNQKNIKSSTTSVNVETVVSAIGSFRALHGRYPCPSSLTFTQNNPAYGREDCTDKSGTAIGNNINGMWIEQSKRAAFAYRPPFGPVVTQPPRVIVGFVPFRHLGLNERSAYDGYGNRIMYVVTEHLTCDNCFAPDQGGIDIINDSGNTALDAVGTAHFTVFSYGENGAGAFTKSGVRLACPAGAVTERENCDYDVSVAEADATYQIALTSTSNGNSNFDDVANYFTQFDIPLWQTSSTVASNIHQKPGGDVAIGMAPNNIDGKADIGGTVRAAVDVDEDPVTNPTGRFKVAEVCDMLNGSCFEPKLIAGDLGLDVGETKTGGMKCPEDDTIGATGAFMIGIGNGEPICSDDLTNMCPDGFVMAIAANGKVECVGPPPANCDSHTFQLCPGIDSTIPAGNHGSKFTVNAGASRTRPYKCNNGNWVPSGAAKGICDCVPGVINTPLTRDCDTGFTGQQTITQTRICPLGTIQTTTDTQNCACDPITETGMEDCPPGHEGAITTTRTHICPEGTWGPWTEAENACTCANKTELQTLACPGNLTGKITQTRTVTCTKTGVNYGDWADISNTCACETKTVQSAFPCDPGYTGSILKERSLQCPAGTWSEWAEVPNGNTCTKIPPVLCSWKSNSSGQGPLPAAIGSEVGKTCACGAIGNCWTRVGTGQYLNYTGCSCE